MENKQNAPCGNAVAWGGVTTGDQTLTDYFHAACYSTLSPMFSEQSTLKTDVITITIIITE